MCIVRHACIGCLLHKWSFKYNYKLVNIIQVKLTSPYLMITILWLCLHPNTLASLILLCICHSMLSSCSIFPEILICIVITIWHWYFWYWSIILSRWVTHYLALTLINKINQAGVTGGDCSRRNLGRCAWKGDPLWVWMLHVIFLFMRALVIICYMIPEYSKLFFPAIRIH